MERTFRISAKEIKKKDGTGSFISCSAKIGDSWYRVKFTQDCERAPRKRGLYDITVDYTAMSIQKGKVKDAYVENDIIWVKEIKRIRKYTDEELNAMNAEKLNKVFGATLEEIEDGDLPF